MTLLTVDHHSIPLDSDGYLQSLDDWTPEVAQALAAAEGLDLTPDHWQIIELLRRFHAQYQLSPATRPLIKYVAQQLGADKGNSMHLNRLFNGTPAKLAAKLAGLPKPTNCI